MLANRYLRSVDVNEISNGVLQSYQFNEAPSAPASSPSPATTPSSLGAGKRLLAIKYGQRKLLQASATPTYITGVILRVQVLTSAIRVQSEVTTMVDAINSGMLASDLQLALGTSITNASFTQQPVSSPYNMASTSSQSGSLPTWAIGVIVGGVLILLPIPLYILYRRRRKSHLSALAKQQAEAAAARQRMQSRILKTGSKTFTTGRYGSPYNASPPAGLPGVSEAILLGPSKSPMPGGSSSGRGGGSSDGDKGGDYIPSNASFRTDSFSTLAPGGASMEAARALFYQQQSLGPAMPPRSPSRSPLRPGSSASPDVPLRQQHSGRGHVRNGSILPIRYPSDEASTSSGTPSDRRSDRR